MPSQKDSGKAFEYALIVEAEKILSTNFKVNIVKDSTFISANKSFLIYSSQQQTRYLQAANASINHLVQLEPKLTSVITNQDELKLQLMPDRVGQKGDVRDILFIRSSQNWEVGISAKNNHKAVKHSRLSDKKDFGKSWLGINCSDNYFNLINPIFLNLRQLKSRKATWPSVVNKAATVYKPVLEAFKDELLLINSSNNNIPETLASYLLGNSDFYKIIKRRKVVEVYGFNLHGTLNKSFQNKQKTNIPKLKLPSQIIQLDFKPGSLDTLILVCDHGWSISFRIHSAESLVVPSLKFDINLIGQPNTMYAHHLPY